MVLSAVGVGKVDMDYVLKVVKKMPKEVAENLERVLNFYCARLEIVIDSKILLSSKVAGVEFMKAEQERVKEVIGRVKFIVGESEAAVSGDVVVKKAAKFYERALHSHLA